MQVIGQSYCEAVSKAHKQHFKDIANHFKALIQFELKISPQKCQIFRDQFTHIGLTFTLKKKRKHSYTLIREQFGANIKMKPPESVKDCRSACGMVSFLSSSPKDLREHLILIYEIQKKNQMA